MKLANLLPMPVSAPASSTTLPPLPRPLADAIDRAESLLEARATITKHLTEQTAALPTLLRAKIDAESNVARAQTGALLDECTDVDVEQAQAALDAAMLDYRSASGVRSSLRARLLDPSAEAALIACKQDIQTLKPDYVQQTADVFTAEYEAASKLFARTLAKGQALSQALRVDIPMAMPAVATAVSMDTPGHDMGDTSRLGTVLDGLNSALTQIVSDRQQVQRESSRRQPFATGCVWELVKPYAPFIAGMWIEAPLISEAVLEKLFMAKIVRRVPDAELSQDRDASASVSA
jgi:hypothetical protein